MTDLIIFREVRWGRMGSSWTGIELYYTPGTIVIITIILVIITITIITIITIIIITIIRGQAVSGPVPCDQSKGEF